MLPDGGEVRILDQSQCVGKVGVARVLLQRGVGPQEWSDTRKGRFDAARGGEIAGDRVRGEDRADDKERSVEEEGYEA